MIEDPTGKLKNKLGFSIRNSGSIVQSFDIPNEGGLSGPITRTDNFLTVLDVDADGNVVTDNSQDRMRQVSFLAQDIPSPESQMWTRGTSDVNGCFRLEHQGEFLTATTTTDGATFHVQGTLLNFKADLELG